MRFELSPQLFVVAIVECVRLVVLLIVAAAGAPRFFDVPRFVAGVHYTFVFVDRVVFWYCWFYDLPYPPLFALQMIDPIAIPLLLPFVWFFGNGIAFPVFVAFTVRDTYALVRQFVTATTTSSSSTDRSSAGASTVSSAHAAKYQHLTDIARKQFPHFSQREVEELVSTFSALDLDGAWRVQLSDELVAVIFDNTKPFYVWMAQRMGWLTRES